MVLRFQKRVQSGWTFIAEKSELGDGNITAQSDKRWKKLANED
jgi:hypothetical protein